MRTLVSYLNERTPQELRSIAEKWEANQVERLYAGQTFELSQEMGSDYLQRRLLEKLTTLDLRALQFFIKQPDYTATSDELAAALDLALVHINLTITTLTQAGLLFPDKVKDTTVKPNPLPVKRNVWSSSSYQNVTPKRNVLIFPRELAKPFQRLIAEKLSDNSTETKVKLSHLPLQTLLEHLEPELIESQAETWGLVSMLGSHVVGEVAQEMAHMLTDVGMQGRVLAQLDSDSQLLFERLKQQHSTTIPALLEEYVSLKRLGRSLRPLTERLLVWEAFEDGKSVVFVPAEIRQPHASQKSTVTTPLQTVSEPTQAFTATPSYALAWDTLSFLNYLGQNDVALTNDLYLPKRHVKKMLTLFWVQDNEERFDFLTNLCQRLRLYTQEEDRRLLPANSELNEWLKLDFYAQMRLFLENWLQNARYLDTVYYPYYYGGQQNVQKANQSMLGWLHWCEPGVWYSLESLLVKVQREEPFFIKSRKEMLGQFGLRQVEEMTRQWNNVEAEIIRRTFGTALEWLGIVQVSRDPMGQVMAFKLTDFGAEVAGLPNIPHQAIPPIEKPLLVQPNFEVMLLAPQVETLWSLLKFSVQKKLDLVSIFALDRPAVLHGMELGFTTTAILEWLAAHNPQPLPQNVVISLQDWGKGFKRVTVEQTVLLETDDPKVLDELMQSKKYAEYFVRRLSPTAAVVRLPISNTSAGYYQRNDPLKTFRNLLKAGGFFAR